MHVQFHIKTLRKIINIYINIQTIKLATIN